MEMKLPLIHLIVDGGWRPTAMQKSGQGNLTYAQLQRQIADCPTTDWKAMERGYCRLMENHARYTPFSPPTAIDPDSSLRISFWSSYTATTTATTDVRMHLPDAGQRSYAWRFYREACHLECVHCLTLLKETEKALQDDNDMKQVVRDTLQTIVHYCYRASHDEAENADVFDMVLRWLTSLYFEVVQTYVEAHPEWSDYIATCYPDELPLQWDCFTATYWPKMYSEEDEKAWETFCSQRPKPQMATDTRFVPTTSHLNEDTTATVASTQPLPTKADLFLDCVKMYGFLELPKMKKLSPRQQREVVELITGRVDKLADYGVAMLCFLDYDQRLLKHCTTPDKKPMGIGAMAAHWSEALGGINPRAIKGNYRLVRNPDSNEDRTKYTAPLFLEQVEQDYQRIANESGDSQT